MEMLEQQLGVRHDFLSVQFLSSRDLMGWGTGLEVLRMGPELALFLLNVCFLCPCIGLLPQSWVGLKEGAEGTHAGT